MFQELVLEMKKTWFKNSSLTVLLIETSNSWFKKATFMWGLAFMTFPESAHIFQNRHSFIALANVLELYTRGNTQSTSLGLLVATLSINLLVCVRWKQ
ncbi:hypothetical protein V6N12_001378 [Hibiscus sabdariffa]|uniref:Uncharacterized protein n=1 Tax=Hibiscus sabdariffa TaxID=183260 RepID=A0ABR2AV53_9ROSI